MPLISPSKGQSKEDFLDACLSNSTINKEFPDSKRRFAVCNSLWRRSKEKQGTDNPSWEKEQDQINKTHIIAIY